MRLRTQRRLLTRTRVAEDPVGVGGNQFAFTVTAGEQADAQHARSLRRQDVPGGVADHVTLAGSDPQPGLAGQEEIRFGLGLGGIGAIDDHPLLAGAEPFESQLHFLRIAGGGNPVKDALLR